MVPKSYKKNIAEGKGILIFAIVFAISIRVAYYLLTDNFRQPPLSDGYLWNLISPFFNEPLYAMIGNLIVMAGGAIMLTHCNTKFALIRGRTLLPAAIYILLSSCHPYLIIISPSQIAALPVLFILLKLFESYQQKTGQAAAFKVGFILALSSFFWPYALIYLPVMWIALYMMRCFGFKSLIASFLGIIILYFPAFSIYLLSDNIEEFLHPFCMLDISALNYLPIMGFDVVSLAIFGLSFILICIILIDNYINLYKDKIRIRAFLSLLSFISIFALLLFLTVNINNKETNLFIAFGATSLLLSHFFALAEKKAVAVLFYIYLIIYFAITIFFFLFL